MALTVGSEGTYGGFTASIAGLAADGKADMVKAIQLAEEERRNGENG